MLSLIAKAQVAPLRTVPSQQYIDDLLRPTRPCQQKTKFGSSQKRNLLLRTPSSGGADKLIQAVPHSQLYKTAPMGSCTSPLLTLRLLEHSSSTTL